MTLRPGVNELLVRVNVGGPAPAFTFALAAPDGERTEAIDATPDELEVLAAGEPSEEQRQGLLARRRERDAKVKELRNRVERLTNGTDYATQRPHPEQSEFLRAFGQPKRESPCACERSSEPTIDQALQLLNGKAVADRLAAAADAYAPLADDALADDLYLTALTQAGLLRPEDQPPTVTDNPVLVSLQATLAAGILAGPAGSARRRDGCHPRATR